MNSINNARHWAWACCSELSGFFGIGHRVVGVTIVPLSMAVKRAVRLALLPRLRRCILSFISSQKHRNAMRGLQRNA